MVIKRAQVDVRIAKMIEWLNGFDDVYTEHSCEGDSDSDEWVGRPYVVFYCEDNLRLIMLLNMTANYADTEVDFFEPAGSLRCRMQFRSRGQLDQFTHVL